MQHGSPFLRPWGYPYSPTFTGWRIDGTGQAWIRIQPGILQNPQDQLEIFILDAHAENYVRIAQPSIELTLTDSNQTMSLGAVADPATGETVGNSALFRTDSNISKNIPLHGILRSLKIGSKTYTDQPFEFSGNPPN